MTTERFAWTIGVSRKHPVDASVRLAPLKSRCRASWRWDTADRQTHDTGEVGHRGKTAPHDNLMLADSMDLTLNELLRSFRRPRR